MRTPVLRFTSILCAASLFMAPLAASAQSSSPSPAQTAQSSSPQAPANAAPGPTVIIVPYGSASPASPPEANSANSANSGPVPASARAANGEFVAPMSQTTQPSYVPQSVAMSGPREIRDWEEGDAIPSGYHTQTRVRRSLIIGGAVTFGALYLLSALTAAAGADEAGGGTNPEAAMWAPVVGPFVQLGSTESSTGKMFLFIDGMGQVAGAAMLIAGLAVPKTVLVRNDLAFHPVLAPIRVGKNGMGMGLTGTF